MGSTSWGSGDILSCYTFASYVASVLSLPLLVFASRQVARSPCGSDFAIQDAQPAVDYFHLPMPRGKTRPGGVSFGSGRAGAWGVWLRF